MHIAIKKNPAASLEKRPYMKHQQAMHDYCMANKNPALLVEMRLGKTLVVVRSVTEKGHKKNLVVAPINAMTAWEKELTLEGISFIRAYALPTKDRIRAVASAFEDSETTSWVLVNYEGFRWVPRISSLAWDTVISDESVKLKNPQTEISKIFTKGFENTKSKVILTGMITSESYLDVFPQFCFLHGRFMGTSNYWTFRMDNFEVAWNGYDWVPKKGKAEEIKQTVHKKAFVLRRQDAGIDKQKIYTTRTVQMNEKQKKLYRQIEEEYAYELSAIDPSFATDEYIETQWATGKALWLKRIAGGFSPDGEFSISTSKLDEIIYLLRNDLIGQQAVVWFSYISELKYASEYLWKAGISNYVMMGSSNQTIDQRRKNEANFNAGNGRVLLAMEKMAAEGKDFSVASVAFYYSNEASCNLRGQSEDRILHPLKDDSLLYIDLITADTIDEELVKNVKQKTFNARAFMTDFSDRRNAQHSLFD